MVSSISGTNRTELYMLSNTTSSNKTTSSSSSSDIIDEYEPSTDFGMRKSINSYQDYVEYRNLNTVGADNYIQGTVDSSVDYKSEFNNYLKSRGCSNETDLQELNSTMFNTMDDLKKYSTTMLQSVFMNMAVNDSSFASAALNAGDYISQASSSELSDFANSTYRDLETTAKGAKTFINSIDATEDTQKLSAGIDALIEALDEQKQHGSIASSKDMTDFSNYFEQAIKKYQQ